VVQRAAKPGAARILNGGTLLHIRAGVQTPAAPHPRRSRGLAERLAGVAQAGARRTHRLDELQHHLVLGGEADARLAGRLGLPPRHAPVQATHSSAGAWHRRLGLAAWSALRHDLERGEVIDLRAARSCRRGELGARLGEAPARHGVGVQVSTREAQAIGFQPLPLRWHIEVTFGALPVPEPPPGAEPGVGRGQHQYRQLP
jgi:hypothetical protein